MVGWFTLLQDNTLLGLTLLNVFDIANYVLVAIMFFALYFALRKFERTLPLAALGFSAAGAVVYTISNSALPMLLLSNQYAAVTTDIQRSNLAAAGEAVLTSSYNPGLTLQSVGFYLSLLFVAVAGMLVSVVMLRNHVFGKINCCGGAGCGRTGLSLSGGLNRCASNKRIHFGCVLHSGCGSFTYDLASTDRT